MLDIVQVLLHGWNNTLTMDAFLFYKRNSLRKYSNVVELLYSKFETIPEVGYMNAYSPANRPS